MFNYQKAYFTLALPAFENLNHNQKDVYFKLIPLVGELTQDRTLKIPLSPAIEGYLNRLTTHELAELSRVCYFIGRWRPGLGDGIVKESKGETWKITNLCDQVLRSRFELTGNLEIHGGKFRVTFSNNNCWMWEEFGLATEKNFDIFKKSGLNFHKESTFKANANTLKELCNDLWGSVDEMPDNKEYKKFLDVEKQKELKRIKQEKNDDLERLEKKKLDIENKAYCKIWLVENDIDTKNCIYYSRENVFCFGWLDPLTDSEKDALTEKLKDSPFKFKFK